MPTPSSELPPQPSRASSSSTTLSALPPQPFVSCPEDKYDMNQDVKDVSASARTAKPPAEPRLGSQLAPSYNGGERDADEYLPLCPGETVPHRRNRATPLSSLMRTGSRFRGTQHGERQVYRVDVTLDYVDVRQSFLCGILKIEGLTENHPSLTTFFEGEIIGPKYSFLTRRWGADDRIDMCHWTKFPGFRPIALQTRDVGPRALENVIWGDITQDRFVFMRWKEKFLVPNHRVRTIEGASFEGFYYICFDQIRGEIDGLYFHLGSERYQRLKLQHVTDRGCLGVMEFM